MRSLTRWKSLLPALLFVVVVGMLHWLVGGYLVFMGTVIGPQPQHVWSATIGFLMLLPFSVLIFVDPLAKFDLVLGAMSGLLWGYLYFLVLRRLLRAVRTMA